MEKETKTLFGMQKKTLNIFNLVIAIFLIVSFLFYPQTFLSNWPYLFLILILFIWTNMKDKSWFPILLIIFLSGMFLLQITYYFVIPLDNNYQPTPSAPLMKMFNIDGKFQVSYYPDLPKAGDNIILYLDVCALGSENCTKCSICSLSGYFENEKLEKKFLFQNVSMNETEYIEFNYPGRRVNINLDFEGIDKRYDSFYVPQLTILESIMIMAEENPLWRWIGIFSTIIFLIGIILATRKTYKNVKQNKEFKTKMNNFFKSISNYIRKKWIFSLFLLSTFIFIMDYTISKKPNLIIGGATLILYGLSSLFSKDKFKPGPINSTLLISLGILAILTATILSRNINIYVFFFMILIFFNLFVSYLLKNKKNIFSNVFYLSIFTILFYAGIGLAKGGMSYLSGVGEGFPLMGYLIILAVFIYLFVTSFMFIEQLLYTTESIGKKIISKEFLIKHNTFLYLAIASVIVILIGGYFYLVEISKEKVRDFLIILGLALISSFGGISALKNILTKKDKPMNLELVHGINNMSKRKK